METKKVFKILFAIGIGLIYASFFLEWYYFEVYNSKNKVMASWSYNPIFEWRSAYKKDYGLNDILRPGNLGFSLPLVAVIFVSGAVSLYAVLFKDLEKQLELEKLKNFSMCNLFLVFLVIYVVVYFPVSYLFTNGLYFPFLVYKDFSSELTYLYLIGPGYIVFSVSFVLIAPYAIFYYRVVSKFRTKKDAIETLVENQIKEIDSSLDFNKLCAEERIVLKNKKPKVKVHD